MAQQKEKKAPVPEAKASSHEDFMARVMKSIGPSDMNQDVTGWLSTGYMPMNKIMSGRYVDGVPRGRITEIFGGESSGKTKLATWAMIETQRLGGLAMFLDYEHAFYLDYAMRQGLSIDPLQWVYKQPDTAEEGLHYIDLVSSMVSKDGLMKPVTIVADSVPAMIPKVALDAGVDGGNMQTKLALAALLSQALPQLAKAISKTNVTLIFLNQTRTKPGVMFGDPETTPGGNALRFFASLRVKLWKSGKVLDEETKEVIGENVHAQVIKSKVSMPFRQCEYVSSFNEGINMHRSHLEALVKLGHVEVAGSWYGLKGGERLGQGKMGAEKALRENPELYVKMLELFSDPKQAAA